MSQDNIFINQTHFNKNSLPSLYAEGSELAEQREDIPTGRQHFHSPNKKPTSDSVSSTGIHTGLPSCSFASMHKQQGGQLQLQKQPLMRLQHPATKDNTSTFWIWGFKSCNFAPSFKAIPRKHLVWFTESLPSDH